MAVRKILLYTEHEKELRKKSSYVRHVNHKARGLIADLKDTLNAHSNAIGLAAPQINSHKRVVIVCLGARSEEDSEHGPPIALINPEITVTDETRIGMYEGCLSIPGLRGYVERPQVIRVNAYDQKGEAVTFDLEGFPAIVLQHEADHLDGILYPDRMEDLSKLGFEKEVQRFHLVETDLDEETAEG